MIFEKTNAILEEIKQANPITPQEIEAFRQKYLGSKNVLKDLMAEIPSVAKERRSEFGKLVNAAKQTAEEKFAVLKEKLTVLQDSNTANIDLTATGEPLRLGSRHPISIVINEIASIFQRLGYTIADGPEIEDEWHNFSALNTPEDHPSRDMQDTYYLMHDVARVLRSQTSTTQVHVMEKQAPPIRIISPGRVYRNETVSARSHCQFHQIEGLCIGENISFADLKQTLLYFANEFYGQGTQIRLRPSFFPFTEPSAEMDVSCFICKGKGCNVCKYSTWVEVLGCGMVDPAVLENCGIDSKKYTGFAFGMGIERQVMMRYGIKDIRVLFENDVRILNQFVSA